MADNSSADSVARILALSSLNSSQTESKIVVTQDIGGIKAGTIYAEGTSVNTIIADLLKGSTPETDITIYYGATDEIPTSVASLTSTTLKPSALVGTYTQNIKAGDITTQKGQYPVFAIPTTYNVTKWCAEGFSYNIPHTKVVNGGYNIYYLNNKSYDVDLGGITYKIDVE